MNWWNMNIGLWDYIQGVAHTLWLARSATSVTERGS